MYFSDSQHACPYPRQVSRMCVESDKQVDTFRTRQLTGRRLTSGWTQPFDTDFFSRYDQPRTSSGERDPRKRGSAWFDKRTMPRPGGGELSPLESRPSDPEARYRA